MALTASSSEGSYEVVPEGTHRAVCYKIVDSGTREEQYKEEDPKKRHSIFIYWELTELPMDDGRPFSINKQYTLSLNENSNLHKDLKTWRGKSFTDKEAQSFDVTNLLGVPCLLSITHKTSNNGKTYANIASVSMLPKGMDCPDQVNDKQELTYSDFKQELFDSLPDFIKEKIMMSKEYQSLNKDTNENLPF